MKRKHYIKPLLDITPLEEERLLAGSVTAEGSDMPWGNAKACNDFFDEMEEIDEYEEESVFGENGFIYQMHI